MHKKLAVFLYCALFQIVAFSQDLIIGGTPEFLRIDSNATPAEKVPTEELMKRVEEIQEARRNGVRPPAGNSLSADELDTYSLQRIYRQLTTDKEYTMLKEVLSESEIEFAIAALSTAYESAIGHLSSRREALCTEWSAPNRSTQSLESKAEQSMEAYKREDIRVQPLVDSGYQNALSSIASQFSAESYSAFIASFNTIRSDYETAHVSKFYDSPFGIENRAKSLDSMCKQ